MTERHPPPRVTNGYLRSSTSADEPSPGWRALYTGFTTSQAQKILDEENITIAHWIYLRVLAERGELNQLELSKRVGMASTTAVPALDSMEKRGLLKRRRDPKDRRKYYVVLTEKGRRLVDKLLPKIGNMIVEIASRHHVGRDAHFLEGRQSYCKKPS